MGTVELVEVEDSLGVVLPEEVLARLKLGLGDVVLLTETPTGIRLTPASTGRCHPSLDTAQQR